MDISYNHYKERSYSISSVNSYNSLLSLSTVGSCDSLKNLERSSELKPIKKNAFSDISNNDYIEYNKRVRDYYINDNSGRNTPNIDSFQSIMVRRNSREYK
tara:strand:+ start:137 stop:439 length:303 start_codon:yes stop_codon:yes gene_type:complete